MRSLRIKLLTATLPLLMLIGLVLASLSMTVVNAQDFGSGWTGVYFNTPDFTGGPVFTRLDDQINFNWGAGSPSPGFVNVDNFSVRWNALQEFTGGTYRFTVGADDGARVTIDGNVVIDNLGNTGSFQFGTADVIVAEGTRDITVEYKETTGNAAVQFYWEPLSTVPTATLGPSPTPTATGLPPIPPGAITGTVIRAAVLNVRAAPSLGGPIVGRILRGQTYQIVGRDENARWFLLQLADFRAWAYGYYLFIDGNEFNPPIASAATVFGFPPGFQDTGVVVQVKAGMKMRQQPNLLSPQNGRIPWGSFLPVVGRLSDNSWFQVIWKGTPGWVFTGFMDLKYGDLNNVPVIP